jgi:hypothetical protein
VLLIVVYLSLAGSTSSFNEDGGNEDGGGAAMNGLVV